MNLSATAYLLVEWTRRDFRIRYTQTLLGSMWAIIQPVALTAAFVFLFNRVAKIEVGIPYASFVFPGMLIWTLFSAGVGNANNAMLGSMHVASKANYPRVVAPLSGALLPGVDFVAGLVLVPLLFLMQSPPVHFLPHQFLLAIIGVLLMSSGLGTFLAAVTVFLRDVRNVVPLGMQLALLVTPVGYRSRELPDWLKHNPMATFVEGFRASVLDVPGPGLSRWVTALAISAGIWLFAMWYFHRVERRFPDVA